VIRDLRDFDSRDDITADLCIVGAGAAGIAMARELARSNLRVCLVESGGLEGDAATSELTRGQVVGLRYEPLERTRIRVFGGTTSVWHGACIPLEPEDFERRAWVPHSGWPIPARSLDPYYPRACEVCELGGDDFSEANWDRLRVPRAGFEEGRLSTRFWRYSPPTRFGVRYRRELEAAPHVEVLLHANATNIVSDRSGSHIESIELRSLGGRSTRIRARAYVLAMGAIENARALLNSRDHAPAGLGNRHDLVGRFFMEHTWAQCGFFVPGDYEDALRRFGTGRLNGVAVAPGFRLSPGLQEREQVLSCAARLDPGIPPSRPGYRAARRIGRSLRAGEWPDNFGAEMSRVLRHLDDVAAETYGEWIHDDPGRYDERGMAIFSQAEQSPNPDSRVTLSDERDALGLRRAALNWQLAEIDRRTVEVLAGQVALELTRLGLGRVQISDWLRPGEQGWGEALSWGHHHAGTTRMAHSPTQGVVDTRCRVHGIDNLYIAGSSVFPTCGYANSTLTIVAMSLRLADHLQDELTRTRRD